MWNGTFPVCQVNVFSILNHNVFNIHYASTYQPWGPPCLLYSGYQISLPGVKWPEHGVNHPLSSITKVKENGAIPVLTVGGLYDLFEGELYLLPLHFDWCCYETFNFNVILSKFYCIQLWSVWGKHVTCSSQLCELSELICRNKWVLRVFSQTNVVFFQSSQCCMYSHSFSSSVFCKLKASGISSGFACCLLIDTKFRFSHCGPYSADICTVLWLWL
jgi:hypothetical protein